MTKYDIALIIPLWAAILRLIKSNVPNSESIFALFRNLLLLTSSESVKEHYVPQVVQSLGRHFVNPSTGISCWHYDLLPDRL
jgi:hypothetical protein